MHSATGDHLLSDWASLWPVAACGHFDELRGMLSGAQASAGGGAPLAPHWQQFFDAMPRLDASSLTQRLFRLQRMIREHGASYHVYGDESGVQRPWNLELFPLLMPAHEWQHIERGVLQRAQLLERLMADIYGPQHLLRDRMLPSALVQGHPGYLRAMHGITPARHLHIVAFDLVHGSDGWWLMGQRTQAPTGLGYVLENRYVTRQLFSQAFDRLGVQHIAHSYRALLQSLQQQCQPMVAAAQTPAIVLLTPGPLHDTWFEHAHLARYLGVPLVESTDLTVRSEQLYLKTLHGLQRVHGVLRWVDDDWLDPLELRAASTLGVPGLLQAMRAGNVVVANSPGSGWMESPALLGFLPPLAQHLLGETLLIPALPTWWCGEAAAMQHALPELQQMVVKPTYCGEDLHHSFAAMLGSRLTAQASAALQQRIQHRGDDYTLQRYMPLSQLPCWHGYADGNGHAVLRSLVLRVFAVADGAGWRVIPGGMARLAGGEHEIASMQRGGGNAAVWVQGAGHASGCTAAIAMAGAEAPAASALADSMPARMAVPDFTISRMAENLFWLGRYTERSENAAHMALLALATLRQPEHPGPVLLRWLQAILASQGMLPAATASGEAGPAVGHMPDPVDMAAVATARSLEHALRDALVQRHGSGLMAAVHSMQHATQVLRRQLPHPHWRLVQEATQAAEAVQQAHVASTHAGAADIASQLHHLSHALAAVTGVQSDRLVHDTGWHLLQLGRMVERLAYVASMLHHALQPGIAHDDQVSAALLALFDNHSRLPVLHTGDPLVNHQPWKDLAGSTQHPRSLAWTLSRIRQLLEQLPPAPVADTPAVQATPAMAPADAAVSAQQQLPWPDLVPWIDAPPHQPMEPGQLQPVLQQCMALAASLTTHLAQAYFDPVNNASQSVGA